MPRAEGVIRDMKRFPEPLTRLLRKAQAQGGSRSDDFSRCVSGVGGEDGVGTGALTEPLKRLLRKAQARGGCRSDHFSRCVGWLGDDNEVGTGAPTKPLQRLLRKA